MLSSYESSIILDQLEPNNTINNKFVLQSKINHGNIILEYFDDVYIILEIQYKNNYIKIYYDSKTHTQKFLYLINYNKYYIEIDKLKTFMIKELNKIKNYFIHNNKYDLFIDSIEYWFDNSYSNDVFM